MLPLFQVEFVAAAGVAGRIAARPRREEATRLGSEIVVQDAKGFCRDFDVGATEESRVVKAFGLQGVEVTAIVKVTVQDGAVVFAAGDEGDGFSAEEEVVRIRGMETDRLRFR